MSQVLRKRVFRVIKNLAKTDDFTFTVPAGCYISDILIYNSTANAITGGLKFGTSSGGTQVVTAAAVGANALKHIVDADITLRIFSLTVDTTIYVQDVTAWNSANVDVYVTIGKL